jgi:uncharacterized protein
MIAMRLRNKTRATTVGEQISIANTSLTRLIGLAGRRRLDSGCGLLLQPSSGIHTFGMRFAIDVVALNRNLEVLKVWRALPPFRMTRVSWKTHRMLELPAGQIDLCHLEVGDQLEFVPDSAQV